MNKEQKFNPQHGRIPSIGWIKNAKGGVVTSGSGRDVYFGRRDAKLQAENLSKEELEQIRADYLAYAKLLNNSVKRFNTAVQIAGKDPNFKAYMKAVAAYSSAKDGLMDELAAQAEELSAIKDEKLRKEKKKAYEKTLQQKYADLEEKRKELNKRTNSIKRALKMSDEMSKKDKETIAQLQKDIGNLNALLLEAKDQNRSLQEELAQLKLNQNDGNSEENQNKDEGVENTETFVLKPEIYEDRTAVPHVMDGKGATADDHTAENIAAIQKDIATIQLAVAGCLENIASVNTRLEGVAAVDFSELQSVVGEVSKRVTNLETTYAANSRAIADGYNKLYESFKADLDNFKLNTEEKVSKISKKQNVVIGLTLGAIAVGVVVPLVVHAVEKDNTTVVNQDNSYNHIVLGNYKTIGDIETAIDQLTEGLNDEELPEDVANKMDADLEALTAKLETIDSVTGWSSDENDMNNYVTGQTFDKNGFDKAGYHKVTGTQYNPEGYDREGYDKDGFNKEGIHKETGDQYNPEGYDREGYDKEGFDEEGYNREGYDKEDYDREGYDKEGYDREGYDKEGYDREGFDKNGYDDQGYDKEGYDEEGYDRDGYDKNGFDIEGIHKDTGTKYDPEGYDRDGYDKYGYDRFGNSRNENEESNNTDDNVSSGSDVEVDENNPGFGMGN